nr:hypothetical protein [Tanacetum cinerariifolium]
MDQQYPTVAKIPVLDTGKFEQWQFWIQQYLQHDPSSPSSTTTTDTTSGEFSKKSGRTVTLTAEDMQKKNDVKARTTLLLSLPDEHQLRFKWLMHTIVWRNRGDLDTMSLDDLYNHLKVYESEVQKKSKLNSHNMAFISSAKHNSENENGNTACVSTASTNVPTASASIATISQDTACAYIASQSSDKFWKKTGKNISIQGSNVAGFDKSKVKCFNYHKMGHFAREYRAPKSQERGRRDNYRHGSKAEEQATKALMEIYRVGWDWSYMENDEEDHALVADEVTLTEFALMANTSAESKRSDKNKDGLGYSAIPPPPAQLYLSPKKDLSWTGLSECADDTVTKFTWTFFLKSKDGTSGILKKFITEIENLKDLKVKIIRTPKQNGVAKRRNRTLIEAARTMLVDAKLPVTIWAEAVNTACYVQNRVLVNKSHNKTPYELFNGRSPVIGFLKPFGYHVMILNTLDNLGKFKEKGDEGYFIGYSMSSKAFRVFNKRTSRVEENLHVEFLENKAIEKGTKDATSQEVKKDASSLRYIALPNWAHDALLELSSSKPLDHCSTEVPEGSGNPNPTTSTSNPPVDLMETLIVETPILTASSPVLTAYSTDSQEPSNESNGVEADISNMETATTASPSPTLRIHKDHPKSQIIGPLDTPIQTRNKSKEVEEQSFIAIIHQKTHPALL